MANTNLWLPAFSGRGGGFVEMIVSERLFYESWDVLYLLLLNRGTSRSHVYESWANAYSQM
jgi:hypothetical protein